MKNVIQKILFPHRLLGFLIFNFGFGLLLYVFGNHLEETLIAYVSYLLSFYALIIFIIWFCRICKFSNEFIKQSKIYHFYQKEFLNVTKITMLFSVIFHLIYGLFKLGIGMYYFS